MNFLLLSILLFLALISTGHSTRRVNHFKTSRSWPSLVAIIFRYDKIHQVICGGVLWNNEYVLTAANCLHPNANELFEKKPRGTFLAMLADGDLEFDGHPVTVRLLWDLKKDGIIYHPGYRRIPNSWPPKWENDLALIPLFNPVNSSSKVQRTNISCVCEPEDLQNIHDEKCIVQGWRFSDSNGIEPQELCEAMVPIVIEDSNTVHISGENFLKLWCYYNGAPLLCPLRSHPTIYTLVGINTRSINNFIRVLPHLEWIERSSGEVPSKKTNITKPITDTTAASSIGAQSCSVVPGYYKAIVMTGIFMILITVIIR